MVLGFEVVPSIFLSIGHKEFLVMLNGFGSSDNAKVVDDAVRFMPIPDIFVDISEFSPFIIWVRMITDFKVSGNMHGVRVPCCSAGARVYAYYFTRSNWSGGLGSVGKQPNFITNRGWFCYGACEKVL